MKTLIVNLDRSTDRLEFQREQGERLGIDWERLAAVNSAGISDEEYDSMKDGWLRPSSRNEIATFFSHEKGWRQAVEENIPVMILEDDAILAPDIAGLLGELAKIQAPIAWNLEAGMKKKLIGNQKLHDWGKYKAYPVILDRGGAAGYVITPAAAKLLLRTPRARPVSSPDFYIHGFPGIQHLQIEPAPVVQMHHQARRQGVEADAAAQSVLTAGRMAASADGRGVSLRGAKFKVRRLVDEAHSGVIRAAHFGRAKRRLVESWEELAEDG